MIDWTKSMRQTFEFYTVDPITWKDLEVVDDIESFNINRDLSNSTLGSATIDCTNSKDECYIRAYLIAVQNGVTYKIPLGTYMIQTPHVNFDGIKPKISLDAYTPLIELKEKQPPIGYTILRNEEIMSRVYTLCEENVRAPVVAANNDEKLTSHFTSNTDDTWLTFLSDLVSYADYRFALDEMGRILFEPIQDVASLQPVWTYDDGNSSILYPSIKDERDLYNIPNVVEVIYSSTTLNLRSRVENNDSNSPISIANRGREIIHREYNPSLSFLPTQEYLDNYAYQLLRELSCLEHTITYSHGYCPVRIGDCVRINYKRAGLTNIKAKVISQSIKCTTGCSVEETASYTTQLWR